MYIEAARDGKYTVLRYLLAVSLLFAAYFVGALLTIGIVALRAGMRGPDEMPGVGINPANLGEHLFLVTLLVPFLPFLLAVLAIVVYLHRRRVRTLFTAGSHFRWERMWFAAALWFALSGGGDLIAAILQPESYVFRFSFWPFLNLFLIAITLLPVQSSAEELLFRGYLMQSFGLLTNSRWMPLLATSLLFAMMHGLNPELSEYGTVYMMSYYSSVGLLLGICTLMDDGLEIALGFHAANNIYSSLIVSPPGSVLATPSLFTMQTADKTAMMLIWAVASLLFLLLLWRRYRWGSAGKLFSALERPENLPA